MKPAFISMLTQAVVATEPRTYLGLKASEWIMIAAIIIGPILAVVTQLVWQKMRQKRDQKLWVFGNLVSLRATPLATDYVRALNYIDMVFYKNKKVRERWKTLLNHLSSDAYKVAVLEQETHDKTRDLTAEMLGEMADDLGYEYDHTQIKGSAYYPRMHGEMLQESAELRRLGVEVLKGKAAVTVKVQK